MSIDLFRDLVIIVFGIAGLVVLVLVATMMFSLYRQVRVIQDTITGTMTTIREVVASGGEAVKPLLQVVMLIEAIRRGVDLVNKVFKKEGGKENE